MADKKCEICGGKSFEIVPQEDLNGVLTCHCKTCGHFLGMLYESDYDPKADQKQLNATVKDVRSLKH